MFWNQIKSFQNYRPLMWEFVKRDIKLKYRNSYLGIIWSVLNPLLITAVLTFIFSNLFKNNIPNFPVYCLSGRLLYGFFSQTTNLCMSSVIRKSSLIKKIYVPKYIYPLAACISGFIIFSISLIPLVGLMILTGASFHSTFFLSIYPLLALFFISLGIGLMLASINVFFRDVEHLYSVVLMIIMYTSAIFYSPTIIEESSRFLMLLNPVFTVISVFRDCILYGGITSSESWILSGVYAVLFMIIGLVVFYKTQDKFILHI